MKNVAVILAGGVGRRLGLDQPKQYLKMAGKTILEHTVDMFQSHPLIDEIAIVVAPSYYSLIEKFIEKNAWTKARKVLCCGQERYLSSLSAIKAYESEGQNVQLIFHDSVRPLVSPRIITDVCHALTEFDAIDVVVPAIDTIVKVEPKKGIIDSIPDRNFLRRGQTPQAFKWSVIKRAYDLALQDPSFTATDDCGIVVKYLPDTPVGLVQGEEANVKLTNPEDIYLLDKLFQLKSTNPLNYDFSAFKNSVMVIFGGNSGIGLDMGNIAKSYGAKVYSFSRSENNVDVSNFESVKEALESVNSAEGRIDYVINSAAILNKQPILHVTPDKVKYLIEVNYLGAVNTTVASYEYLKKSSGQILQFTSSSYTRGRRNYSLYSSSKAAVVNFVQAIAEEWNREGIRINCINPQRTATPMRVANFGVEDPNTLLTATQVATVSLQTLLNKFTGEVIDVKLSSL